MLRREYIGFSHALQKVPSTQLLMSEKIVSNSDFPACTKNSPPVQHSALQEALTDQSVLSSEKAGSLSSNNNKTSLTGMPRAVMVA